MSVDGARLGQVSKFKYFGCVLDDSGTDETVCRRKVMNARKAARPI